MSVLSSWLRGVPGIAAALLAASVGCAGARPARPLDPGSYDDPPAMEVLPELDVPLDSLGERFRFAWRLAAEALQLKAPPAPVRPSGAELRAWSDGPLKQWLAEKSRRVEAARKELDELAEHGRRLRIVAGAVVGLLYEDVARALVRIPAPRELDEEPEIAEAYREVILFQARPYLTHARRAYRACALNAVPMDSMRHWGRFCARRGRALPRSEPERSVPSGQTEVTVEADF